MKTSYIVIPLIALGVSLLGSWATNSGMTWYKSIQVPPWTPPGAVIGIVWTCIFVLTSISAIITWNDLGNVPGFRWIITLFVLNAILNMFWSLIFFGFHNIQLALVEMLLLLCSVVGLMILILPYSGTAAWLLAPYALWVGFATILTYTILGLNR